MYIYIYTYTSTNFECRLYKCHIYRVIMKVKKHFHLKRFNVSLLQLSFSVLYIYSFYI